MTLKIGFPNPKFAVSAEAAEIEQKRKRRSHLTTGQDLRS